MARSCLSSSLQGEAVAALRLGGGGAPGEHLVHPPEDVGRQLLLARPAGGRHGREDAAAGRRDLLVGLAGQARRELLLAAAGPGQVGVGIDEARDQRAAAAVEALGVRQLAELAPPLLGVPTKAIRPSRQTTSAPADPAHPSLLGAAPGRRAFRGRHLGEIVDEEAVMAGVSLGRDS